MPEVDWAPISEFSVDFNISSSTFFTSLFIIVFVSSLSWDKLLSMLIFPVCISFVKMVSDFTYKKKSIFYKGRILSTNNCLYCLRLEKV